MKCVRPTLALIVVQALSAQTADPIPITGREAPELAPFDRLMTDLMRQYRVPGGAFAISRNGRLLLAHGYGWADRDARTAMQPESLFRIASVSKPITAVAVMKLVEEGRLNLEVRAFDLLSYLQPPPGAAVDPRLASITVRQLLYHAGGWDREASFDPMFRPLIAAQAVGAPAPASCETVIRYMLGQRLDFAPGSRYAYSNFGYCVLGRIIEQFTGISYEDYVRGAILTPTGITRMRIGRSLAANRASGEVKYYDYPGAPLAASVFPGVPGPVPSPYGGFHLEAMDAHGGWIASAVDLVRFSDAVDGRRGARLLTAASVSQLTARPPAPLWVDSAAYYAMGFLVRPTAGDANWWHGGSLPGTVTLLVRTYHGYSWAVLFNMRPQNEGPLQADIDNGVWRALGQVRSFPQHDLYPSFEAGIRPAIESTAGVVHGPTFLPGIVPGAWVTILGRNLAGSTRTWRGDEIVVGRLPESLDGVRVTINGKPAAVYYISPGQLNVQAPDDTAFGPVTVQVARGLELSEPVQAELRRYAPGFFTYAAGGKLFLAAVHPDGVVAGDPSVVPGTRPVQPGGRLLLFGSGFEPSPAGRLIPEPILLSQLVTVRFGRAAAAVEYAGTVAAGLVQVNVVVPEGVAGDVEVTAEIAGARSPGGVVVRVE